ncbi:integrase catalytic domain-containing protein [Trichonephila clavipes]|nr:integrase catalytic domain-containing protein [Trichonephila clavipes]
MCIRISNYHFLMIQLLSIWDGGFHKIQFPKDPPNFYIHRVWQETWDQQVLNKLHSIHPSTSHWAALPVRRHDVHLTRLRIGHTRFTHRHLLLGENAPECPSCKVPYSCRRFKSRSLVADPSLPADHKKDAAIFKVIGVDSACPLYLKRAKRDRPHVIYSDNGTNFRGAYNELMAIDCNDISRYAEMQRMSWKFIYTPYCHLVGWSLGKNSLNIKRASENNSRKEYHGQSVQRHRQDPQSSDIQVGYIVLIGDDVKKRLQWTLASVIQVIPEDELVRTVRVKTQPSSIQRIFPLETSGSDFQELLNPPADSSMKTLDNDVDLFQVSRFVVK